MAFHRTGTDVNCNQIHHVKTGQKATFRSPII